VEREELERVKSALSQPCLNFLIRKSTWAIRRRGAFPKLLDVFQFELICETCEKAPNIEELFIPDYGRILD
jgi:hypothetical protein